MMVRLKKIASWFRKHARLLCTLLGAMLGWLTEPFALGIALALGIPLAVILIFGPQEHFIRYVGLFFQLFGVWKVSRGFRAWLHRLPRYGPIHGAAPSQVITATAVVRSARPIGRGGPKAGAEERFAAIENNLEGLTRDFSDFRNEFFDKLQAHEAALKKEIKGLEAHLRDLREELTATETRGLDIAAVGAFFVALGAVMATIPVELAHLFG